MDIWPYNAEIFRKTLSRTYQNFLLEDQKCLLDPVGQTPNDIEVIDRIHGFAGVLLAIKRINPFARLDYANILVGQRSFAN